MNKMLPLASLPPPPLDKLGWPWTEESSKIPETMLDGKACPKISIITPSYNQGQFLEETIRSVILQNYPNLEYIVIDGGSTDNSVEIIKKYEKWITYWVSEKDRGQAHGINKGFEKATGDIFAWLNSDDIYFPGVFSYVATRYMESDPAQFWIVTAAEYYDQERGQSKIGYQQTYNLMDWLMGSAALNQQASFWSRYIQLHAGQLKESMQYSFDKEFFVRLISMGYRYQCLNEVLGARYRYHNECKWMKSRQFFKYENIQIALDYLPKDIFNYKKVKKDLLRGKAHYRIRFSQDSSKKLLIRLWDLLVALRYSPATIFSKAFIGSLLRAIIPGYATYRNKNLKAQ